MFYCGIDLSARDSHLCVLDEHLSVHLQRKASNDLPLISSLLEQFKPHLKIVVESTFNCTGSSMACKLPALTFASLTLLAFP
jgi:hypothetical protein